VVKANRNPKLPLSVAWQHYWTTLFSEGTEWRADLEHEIKKRLYYPGKSHSFMSVAAQNLDHPKKLEELEIHIQGTVVTVSLQRNEVGPFPLFLNQNRLAISNWANGNPLEKSADRPDRVQENRYCWRPNLQFLKSMLDQTTTFFLTKFACRTMASRKSVGSMLEVMFYRIDLAYHYVAP